MSEQGEDRYGMNGEKKREEYLKLSLNSRGIECWPLLPEQRAFTVACESDPAFRLLANRLLAIYERGKRRFSLYQTGPTGVAQSHLEQLVEQGLLLKHIYPSGAWQYGFSPFSRSWFMAVITASKPAEVKA